MNWKPSLRDNPDVENCVIFESNEPWVAVNSRVMKITIHLPNSGVSFFVTGIKTLSGNRVMLRIKGIFWSEISVTAKSSEGICSYARAATSSSDKFLLQSEK